MKTLRVDMRPSDITERLNDIGVPFAFSPPLSMSDMEKPSAESVLSRIRFRSIDIDDADEFAVRMALDVVEVPNGKR